VHARIPAVILLALCLVLVSLSAAAGRDPIALGYSHDPAQRQDLDMAVVDATIERLGAVPATWTLWSDWGSRGGESACRPGLGRCAFPTEAAAGLMERGITPFIWWTPVGPPGPMRREFARYIHIINGQHDEYIREWATAARDHRGPIILRFAHEMNGRWYPWGITQYDNTAARFVEAWQHIWEIFQEVGATNVLFLWSPAREYCVGCVSEYRYEDFYPGNKYVDYVGLNAYNGARSRWRSLATVLEKPMARLQEVTRTPKLPRGKPVILGEVGSHHLGGDKAAWLTEGYDEVFRRWPRVQAIVYFDVDMRPRNKTHLDWRLAWPADGSAVAAYRELASQPRFKGRIPRPGSGSYTEPVVPSTPEPETASPATLETAAPESIAPEPEADEPGG